MTPCQFFGRLRTALFLRAARLAVGSLFFLDVDLQHKLLCFFTFICHEADHEPYFTESETCFFLDPAMIWKRQRIFKMGNVVTELFYSQYIFQTSTLLGDALYASIMQRQDGLTLKFLEKHLLYRSIKLKALTSEPPECEKN